MFNNVSQQYTQQTNCQVKSTWLFLSVISLFFSFSIIALVLVNGERCSPQTIVTRCTLYQQFTTDEALQEAAKSYKGLTKDV